MSSGRRCHSRVGYPAGMAKKLQQNTIWKRPQNTASATNATVTPTSLDDLNLAIATIKASLGLSITELSTCLDTARQTIYAWIRQENLPHAENVKRLKSLYRVAESWKKLSPLPAKEFYTEISKLLAPNFDVDKAVSTLEHAFETPKIKPRQKSNFEQLLEKHGIDINTLPSQDEQFDLITGKSNFFGELDEPEK